MMKQDQGASSDEDEAFEPTASSPQAVSQAPVSIPRGGYLLSLVWAAIAGLIFVGRADLTLAMEALVIAFVSAARADILKGQRALAQAIEAQRAETGTGSVHESAVPQEGAQKDAEHD